MIVHLYDSKYIAKFTSERKLEAELAVVNTINSAI